MSQLTRLPYRPAEPDRGPQAGVVFLRAQDLFRDLSADDLKTIHEMTRMRWHDRGSVFYGPGDPGEQLFLLKRGRVTLYRLTPGGRKLVVGIVEAGTIFGEMAIAGQSMRQCFAEAHEDALVCSIARPAMERILERFPAVNRRLLQVVGSRLQRLEERFEHMAYWSVRQRLAGFLLNQARPAPGGCQVAGFSHEQIGEAVGASRQTVSQELRALAANGLVEVGRKRVRLIRAADLRSIAGVLQSADAEGLSTAAC
ncbi:MAG: Crp/Fnr family transcriptional regulator [Chloroflexi bacterium]|nr:Crp/Fnr family transcriptional regulator [Chloroflexota bacterium]